MDFESVEICTGTTIGRVDQNPLSLFEQAQLFCDHVECINLMDGLLL